MNDEKKYVFSNKYCDVYTQKRNEQKQIGDSNSMWISIWRVLIRFLISEFVERRIDLNYRRLSSISIDCDALRTNGLDIAEVERGGVNPNEKTRPKKLTAGDVDVGISIADAEACEWDSCWIFSPAARQTVKQ